MALETTYGMVGIKEDVADVINNISPTRTPVYSMLPKRGCDNTLFEWQERELLDANPDNALVEGGDPTTQNNQPTLRQNRTQIFNKAIQVSGTSRAVSTYGRMDELTDQLELAGKEIKRDIESALVGRVQAPVTGDASTTARKTGSFLNFVHSDTTVDGGGALSEANVNSMLEKVYTEGGEPSYLLTHPSNALTIAGFATASGRQRDFHQSTTLVNVIDFLVTPHASVEVVQDIFMSANHLLALDTSYGAVRELRAMNIEELAKTGDADTWMLVTELGVEVGNGKAHGLVSNI